MIFTKGLAFELKYQDSKKVEINLGKEFVKVIFEGLTKAVNETWEKATVYDDVNYIVDWVTLHLIVRNIIK